MVVAKLTRKDAFAIILEDIRSNFKAFGEGLSGLRDDMRSGFKEVHQRLDRVEIDISIIKIDMADVKRTLRVYDDKFPDHEVRISNLENT